MFADPNIIMGAVAGGNRAGCGKKRSAADIAAFVATLVGKERLLTGFHIIKINGIIGGIQNTPIKESAPGSIVQSKTDVVTFKQGQ
ncbi:hypothetical protein L596_022145 [Steinernema carpocapsae]|uniref:Uncharacterized protein n=1 Tax=Steinernema carpocapsae TaxID=34508 RepID=A0A4U5MKY3_STECR|nr:hypothetical protein L596_022145 [Steinernema carpocapsae]